MATKTAHVVNIGADDKRLIDLAQVRKFEADLGKVLRFADETEMHLSRLESAHDEDALGGWPEGYVFSVEALAACALLADELEHSARHMQEWAKDFREKAPRLYWYRGEGGFGDA